MQIELKNKWVEALRSGQYKQGTGGLYNEETCSHCCLGVLCEVAGLERLPSLHSDPFSRYFDGEYYGNGTLPTGFANQLGIEGYVLPDLILMNDNLNKSFSEIADWIEKRIP